MNFAPCRIVFHVAVAAFGLAVAVFAQAQMYPMRPITVVVPYPAGGSTDVMARILAEHMRTSLGQPLIVENAGGAGGSIGTGRVARAAPDGYTFGIGNVSTHVMNGVTYGLNYDLLEDLTPVSLLADTPLLLIARSGLPAMNLSELIAWLKTSPDKATAGIVGVGDLLQMAGIYFQKSTGTRFEFVPYKGDAPLAQDLMGGHIDMVFGPGGNWLTQLRGGRVKAYAVMAKDRWRLAPDIPTIDEAGVPGIYASFWHGLWVPKATPSQVVGRISSAVVDALADARVRQRYDEVGHDIPARAQQTADALRARQKAEIDKWWPILKAAGIKAE